MIKEFMGLGKKSAERSYEKSFYIILGHYVTTVGAPGATLGPFCVLDESSAWKDRPGSALPL